MGRQNERRLSLPYIAAAFIGVTLSARCADRSAPIPVEFWRVGDDALSQKFAVAVETAFRRSPDFRLTALGTGRTLVVWIMSNVKTEMAGKRKKATYTVRFSWMDDSTSKFRIWTSGLLWRRKSARKQASAGERVATMCGADRE